MHTKTAPLPLSLHLEHWKLAIRFLTRGCECSKSIIPVLLLLLLPAVALVVGAVGDLRVDIDVGSGLGSRCLRIDRYE